MKFSFKDYQDRLVDGSFKPPQDLQPYFNVDLGKYYRLEESFKKKNKGANASWQKSFRELSNRVGKQYSDQASRAQIRSILYSQQAFPAYRFILPEIIVDDWLAIVDWHKFQRDHILHQPLTAYIVYRMLLGGRNGRGRLVINDRSLLDHCIDRILDQTGTDYFQEYMNNNGAIAQFGESNLFRQNGKKRKGTSEQNLRYVWKSLFLEAAYLAATFHDLGYPWQYVNLLDKQLNHANHDSDRPTNDATETVKRYGDRFFFLPFNGYRIPDRSSPSTWPDDLEDQVSKALRDTHGLPGAIGFLYLNDVIREFPPSRPQPIRQFVVEWAAMAIMMHDMSKIYWGNSKGSSPQNPHLRVKASTDPLSAVITLADLLQDFQRPIIDFVKPKGNTIQGKHSVQCKETKIELVGDMMKLKYGMKDDTERLRKDIHLSDEKAENFDPRYGYLDLRGFGINYVDMEAYVA